MIVRKVWEIAWDQWKHRCKIVHEPSDKEYRDVNDVDIEVHAEYLLGIPPRCPSHLRQYFRYKSVDTVIKRTMKEKLTWIKIVKKIRVTVNALASTDSDLIGMRTVLHRWLATANPTPPET